MVQTLIFIAFLGFPLLVYLFNAYQAKRESGGIAAGIPKPKTAKEPKAARVAKARKATVRSRRTTYCGRGFTHFALALIGSQDACRYCGRLEAVPPDGPEPGPEVDSSAALAEAEEIIHRANQ